jgi:hypothetical protein
MRINKPTFLVPSAFSLSDYLGAHAKIFQPLSLSFYSFLCNTLLALMFLVLFFQGCSTIGSHPYRTISERPVEYERFFKYLDKAVNEAGVRESSTFPVAGFPYLRTDRFLVGIQDRVANESQKELWVQRMRQHDLVAREKEIRNLPDSALAVLSLRLEEPLDRKSLIEKVNLYSAKLLTQDQRQSDFYDALKASSKIQGEYSTALRILGLYPIWALPVKAATTNVYDEFRQWHKARLEDLEVLGTITVYAPQHVVNLTDEDIRSMFRPAKQNAVGVPQLTDAETTALVTAFAPVLSQDVVDDYDRMGEIVWQDNHVRINPQNPVVYYYITYAFFKGLPVLQLNYTFWYSGRYGPNSPRIERGPLDGITVRITFDPTGRTVMADVMNNCGCYYFFIPRKEYVKHFIVDSSTLYPFVPTWLPKSYPAKQLNLRINSGWHQVQHVDADNVPPNALSYALIPYDHLEMLPKADGRSESIFDSKGIVKDSTRIEPVIFFPSGIPSIGFMRQRGHHAIKLVGKAHFDDPELFDNNFEFR